MQLIVYEYTIQQLETEMFSFLLRSCLPTVNNLQFKNERLCESKSVFNEFENSHL